MTNESHVNVYLSARFKKDIKRLVKKYRNIRSDVQVLIDQLEHGDLPGDKITGADYPVFKVRVQNSDIDKGKSGGYRVIYYVRTATRIFLVTLYSKTEQTDIQVEVINRIIRELGLPPE
ncbi:MAG: type II toxin-antitoxin system RelE/ParE family toxin [Anaerolineae bacterium]